METAADKVRADRLFEGAAIDRENRDALAAAGTRMEALRRRRVAAMDVIRDAVHDLAEFAGASEAQRGMSLGAIEEEIGELCWDMQAEIENAITDAEDVLDQQEGA